MSPLDISPPACLLQPMHVPEKLLMGPGPSNCPPRVLKASAKPVLGHLHPEFLQIMDDVKAGIQYVLQTRNTLTCAISGTGHAAMEACFCNLVEPGDVVLIGVHGIWGERAADMAERHGADVRKLIKPAGQNFNLSEIGAALYRHKPTLFFITHGESSTGVVQQMEGIGALCHSYNCLLVVDTVASLGGVPLCTDQLEIDVIYTGSQKVLGAPPGTAPISFSPRAQTKLLARKTPVRSFYMDMNWLANYWGCDGQARKYHHTGPISSVYALREGLAMISEEGLENCWKRHKQCAERLHEGIKAMGLKLFVEDPNNRLPTVTTICVPEGIDWKAVTTYCMQKHMVEISGGLGQTAGKVWRIGIMGYNAHPEKVDQVLAAFKEGLNYASRYLVGKL